jgi:hypothetical protein
MDQFRVSLLVLVVVLFAEAVSWFFFREFPPFLNRAHEDPVEFSESSHPLYSMLDPSLGYTFRSGYSIGAEDRKNLMFEALPAIAEDLGNGFIRYRHEGQGEPVVIVTLGNCSTDAHLFKGNWPLQLHRILASREIPHEIYNGAVSGYNSFQELTKLTRDVFKLRERVDFVISYNGFTDLPFTDDLVLGFSGVHPYQKSLIQQTAGQTASGAKPVVLPNTQYLFRWLKTAYFSPQVMNVQLGVRSDSTIEDYARNVRFMGAVAASQGAEFIHVIQALMVSEEQRDRSVSLSTTDDPGLDTSAREFFGKISDELRHHPFTYRLDDVLKGEQEVFYSLDVLSPKGQRLVASSMVEIMKKSPKWRYLKE